MIRFSHEANSWQYLIEYTHYPNLNRWVNCSWRLARNCFDCGFNILID